MNDPFLMDIQQAFMKNHAKNEKCYYCGKEAVNPRIILIAEGINQARKAVVCTRCKFKFEGSG